MHNTCETTCPAITVIRQPIVDAIYSEVAEHRILFHLQI
jgi:hypothetical protein